MEGCVVWLRDFLAFSFHAHARAWHPKPAGAQTLPKMLRASKAPCNMGVVFFICLLPYVRAVVINVQPGVDTLWQALDAANAGDELVLADGTYTAQNVIVGKPMTIRELNAHGAILDGQGTSRVVSIQTPEPFGPVVLDGLNITGGSDGFEDGSARGGGVGIQRTSRGHWWRHRTSDHSEL